MPSAVDFKALFLHRELINNQLQSSVKQQISMTFLLTTGTKQETKRTGTCKDTPRPETITVFSGVSHHALKTGMSIPIPPISELLLMYLFWGTLKSPCLYLSGTLHRKITLPILSFGKKQTNY